MSLQPCISHLKCPGRHALSLRLLNTYGSTPNQTPLLLASLEKKNMGPGVPKEWPNLNTIMRYAAFSSFASFAVSDRQACLAALLARASRGSPFGGRARACSMPELVSAAVGPNLQTHTRRIGSAIFQHVRTCRVLHRGMLVHSL